MTTTDPFTTPAEAEREARVKQAQDFLALAMTPERLAKSTWVSGNDYRYSYEDGVQAVRDALVGQGYALLTVRDELADIAQSLRTLAAMPSAVHCLGDQVKSGLEAVGDDIRELTATVNQGVEFADSTAAATGSVAAAVHELTDTVDRLAEPQPRWWQRRLRRAIRQQNAQIDIEH